MRKSITYRIPRYRLVHINIKQDELFNKMVTHLISNEVVLHNKEQDFDYVIKEVRTSEDLIKGETIVEFDIDIIRGEYNSTSPIYLMGGKSQC